MKMNFQNNQQQVSATKNINTTIKESIKERMTTAAGNGRWHSVVQKQYPPTRSSSSRPNLYKVILFAWPAQAGLGCCFFGEFVSGFSCGAMLAMEDRCIASPRVSGRVIINLNLLFLYGDLEPAPQQQYNIDPLPKTIMNHQVTLQKR